MTLNAARIDNGISALPGTRPGAGLARSEGNLAVAGEAAGPELVKKPDVDAKASELLGSEQAVRLQAIAYAFEGARLLVAMMNPADLAAADEVAVTCGHPIRRMSIAPVAFAELMREVHGITAAQMAARLGGAGDADELVANLDAIEADDLHRMAEQPSLINLVNLLVLEGIRARASDVHVEPFERQLTVKYRVDGVLVEQESPPKQLQAAITSRIKIMAGMNIAERYAPQDGHISLRFEGRKIDIRVSTVPTLYGESVVMRILDRANLALDPGSLGFDADLAAQFLGALAQPHGIMLVTGPTGSGKTTTLYAALAHLNARERKLMTIEDPIEYRLPGVVQSQVNPVIGYTFSSALRSFLRQDPDVMMVGEIRDSETAQIAVQAALTGHMILSTLHTNTAAGAVTRLLDMGVEPFLLSSVLTGVLAQRLVRRLCPHCREPYKADPALLERLGITPDADLHDTFYHPVGCPQCKGSGYAGRMAVFEFIRIDREMAGLILHRADTRAIAAAAARAGSGTLRADGIAKARQGLTALEEVLRVASED